MIAYQADVKTFLENVKSGSIVKILEPLVKVMIEDEPESNEIRSWEQSLPFMAKVLDSPSIPHDAGIFLEYKVPGRSKRVDFIITGLDAEQKNHAVLIELKQWQHVKNVNMRNTVQTWYQNTSQCVSHPSYQVCDYVTTLQDFVPEVSSGIIQLSSCVYLHNYVDDHILTDPFFGPFNSLSPLFFKDEEEQLRAFIASHIHRGDNGETINIIENSKLKPSKLLIDSLDSMSRGNEELTLSPEQEVSSEKIVYLASQSRKSNKKYVLIINGGPGTGKTVVAIKTLIKLIKNNFRAYYIAKNYNLRKAFQYKLADNEQTNHANQIHLEALLRSPMDKDLTSMDVALVDEGHRLTKLRNNSKSQVEQIIEASQTSIFFVDEDQIIGMPDMGTMQYISECAERNHATIKHHKLKCQFRCGGMDNYLPWLDHMLNIRPSHIHVLNTALYDFQIMDTPEAVMEAIVKKDKENPHRKSRVVAGYCWDWISENSPNNKMTDLNLNENFNYQWNLKEGDPWIVRDDSIYKIGCIHTCQGLELEYVGVIIGPDLIYENGKVTTKVEERAVSDNTVIGFGRLKPGDKPKNKTPRDEKKLDQIVRNTYKVLLTRGMKGCYVYCCDPNLAAYFGQALKK